MSELIEREALLSRLEGAEREGGRLMLVGAEAGGGKTTLVQAFLARRRGRVLIGGCERLATPVPLGALLDVAQQARGRLASDIRAGRPARHVALSLLEELQRPAVLVVEDAHWADEATLDVLRVLGRRVAGTPSLVIVTYRDDDAVDGHPLRRLLGEFATVAAVERLAVPPLSLAAVCELAVSHGADGAAVYTLTRGNPFFVTEVLASGVGAVPGTVRDAVLARTAQLSRGARALLEGVALTSARSELWLLDAAFPQWSRHVDECVLAGVLQATPGVVAFRHELARLAVQSTVAPRRSKDIHTAILRALEAAPAGVVDSARLAHHAQEAGEAAAVVRHGRAAAERAARTGAHREATAQYATVLRHSAGVVSADRADLLAAYALEAQASGAYEDAITALREAIQVRRSLGDPRRTGSHLARLTMPYILLGRNAEADAASLAAIEILDTLAPSPELAMAHGFRAYVQMIQRDNDAAVRSGRRATTLARRFGEQETLALSLTMTGTAFVMAGEIDQGVALIEQSLQVAEAHELEHRIAGAHWMLGSGLGEMYELERAEPALREHIAFADEHDLDASYTQAWLAAVLVYRGRWPEGTALAAELLAGPVAAVTRITASVALGRVRARRGDPGAGAVLDDALTLAGPGGHLQRIGHVHAARAEAAWLAGDAGSAAAEARSAYPLALQKRHLWFAGELAYWQWKAGGLDAVPEWIAEPYRRQIDGDHAGAAERWRRHGCPYEAARALAESDLPADVVAALADFERLGANPAAMRARERLRMLGASVPRGPRATTRANPARLTSRELEVLRLIAEGLRNAEVARRLVLSPRTVERHVSAILGKLRATTRGEAVAAATRLGLFQDG